MSSCWYYKPFCVGGTSCWKSTINIRLACLTKWCVLKSSSAVIKVHACLSRLLSLSALYCLVYYWNNSLLIHTHTHTHSQKGSVLKQTNTNKHIHVWRHTAGVKGVWRSTVASLSLWYLSLWPQNLGEWYSFGPAPGAPAWEPASHSGPRRAGLALASSGPPERSRLRPGLHNTQQHHTINNMDTAEKHC